MSSDVPNIAGERYQKADNKTLRVNKKDTTRRLAKIIKLRYVDNLTMEDIGKIVGLHRETIRGLCKPFEQLLENPEQIKTFKKYEADILDSVRMLMAQGMYEQLSDPERRKSLDLSRLTYGFGVLYDKMRLERGESTSNVMTLSDLVKQAHAKDVTPVEEEAELVESEP